MGEPPVEKPTVYIETTIASYLAGRPSLHVPLRRMQEATRRWWDEERIRYTLFISARVIEESGRGDPGAAAKRLERLWGIEVLESHPDIETLAGVLRDEIPIPESSASDALHMAFAIYYEMDYLLTWNCAHLANPRCARRLADLSREHGFWVPIICTPGDLIERMVE